jgi:hypothetical protein
MDSINNNIPLGMGGDSRSTDSGTEEGNLGAQVSSCSNRPF